MSFRPVIWKLQEPPPKREAVRDYGELSRSGRIVTILRHDECPSIHPVECERKLKEALSEFRSGDSVLWCGGDPMTAFIAGKVMSDLGLGAVRWLRWDRAVGEDGKRLRVGTYVPVSVIF